MLTYIAAKVQAELAELQQMQRCELLELWGHHFKSQPLHRLSRKLIIHTIAYRIQEKAFGGLKPAVLRQLRSISSDQTHTARKSASRSTDRLAPGTQLLREWNDQTYYVIVLQKGFLWNGLTFPSLSAVARDITGARWSGPRFFGLNGERGS